MPAPVADGGKRLLFGFRRNDDRERGRGDVPGDCVGGFDKLPPSL